LTQVPVRLFTLCQSAKRGRSIKIFGAALNRCALNCSPLRTARYVTRAAVVGMSVLWASLVTLAGVYVALHPAAFQQSRMWSGISESGLARV